jgi:ABC-2 type transport system ATP-binding protein
MAYALEIHQLNKHYQKATRPAVDGFSIKIPLGRICGLLGPNGAGKTSLISCICGLMPFDSGQIIIDKKDRLSENDAIKNILGIVPQEYAFYGDLTAEENLWYFGTMFNLEKNILKQRVHELLHRTGLIEAKDQLAQEYSGGMKRRLNIAIGIIHQPKILLLDEPTVGVDVQSKANIIEFLKEQNAQGLTIIYTSHLMEEAENFCHDIAIMDHGKLLYFGDMHALKKDFSHLNNLEEIFLEHTGRNYRS